MSEKKWTKEELENAYEQGNGTWSGGAKWLTANTDTPCKDPRTFKRHYLIREDEEEEEQTQQTPQGFYDPRVENILTTHLEQKEQYPGYSAVIELADKIERNKVQISKLQEKNKEYERNLRNMELEEKEEF